MRKLATAAFSFSAAIFLAQYVICENWLLYCAILSTVIALICLFVKKSCIRLRILLAAAGLTAGLLWNLGYSHLFVEPAETLNNRTETISAVVTEFPEKTDYGNKLIIRVLTEDGPRIKTILYIYDDATIALKPGDEITVTARFALSSVMNNEETDLFVSKGIYLLAYTNGDYSKTGSDFSIKYIPQYIKNAIKSEILESFPKDIVGFMQALIIGDKTLLSKEIFLINAMSTSGISHVIAVSGMHIVFLIGLINLMIRRKRLASLISVVMIFLFMAVVGFSPSVTRAGILQLFIISAPLFRRESDSITSLSAALMLLLIFNPYAATGVGLQLSFAASLGIILITPSIYQSLHTHLQKPKLLNQRIIKPTALFLISGFSATIGALAFTVPITAAYFGYISLVAPLTNLLVLWAVTLAFCGGILVCLLGLLWNPLGIAGGWLLSFLVRYIFFIVRFFSKIPFAALYTINIYIKLWVLYIYALFISFFAYQKKLRQLAMPVCFAAVSLCIVLLVSSLSVETGILKVTALNVGQGQSTIITAGTQTVLIDCGGNAMRNAGDIASDYLLSVGRSTIDFLIVTHFHEDHANGISELLNRIEVNTIFMPELEIDEDDLSREIIELASAKDIDIIFVSENLLVSLGDSKMNIYAPIGSRQENELGLSLLWTVEEFDILITGDMSAVMERKLIAAEVMPDIELLVVGHHGSKYSTSSQLLDAVLPDAAIISVGHNHYGHPADETIQRLLLAGISIYRTDQHGNITVTAW